MNALTLTRRTIATPLHSLRSFLPALYPSWSCQSSSNSSSSLLFSLATPAPTNSSWSSVFPSFSLESLLELIPPIVWASVPKKKVSPSRKKMRSAHKGLKNKSNISLCPACGTVKLMHHLCPNCYSQISRRWKHEARSQLAASAVKT
ncbi:hypothetical protein L204_100882 [Cryptococcus depauperatus]|nr:ribosomal protein L32 [Cryptococcus depauperatus CBS 7855]